LLEPGRQIGPNRPSMLETLSDNKTQILSGSSARHSSNAADNIISWKKLRKHVSCQKEEFQTRNKQNTNINVQ
jgi:hypothetical protein